MLLELPNVGEVLRFSLGHAGIGVINPITLEERKLFGGKLSDYIKAITDRIHARGYSLGRTKFIDVGWKIHMNIDENAVTRFLGEKNVKMIAEVLRADSSLALIPDPDSELYWQRSIKAVMHKQKESDAYIVGLALLNKFLYYSLQEETDKAGFWKMIGISPFKILHGGEPHEQDITIYSRSLANTLDLLNRFDKISLSVVVAGEQRIIRLHELFANVGSNQTTESLCYKFKYAIRFETRSISKASEELYHAYGTLGIPMSSIDFSNFAWGSSINVGASMQRMLHEAISFFGSDLFISAELYEVLYYIDRQCRGLPYVPINPHLKPDVPNG